MPRLISKYFGELEYAAEAVFEFPAGIHGFENHKSFVFLDQPQAHPLVFVQSLTDSSLCFLAVPVLVADPAYCLTLAPEWLDLLQWPEKEELRIGAGILCLALVTANAGENPTANLAAPIVVNLERRIAVQAIPEEHHYSFRHPLVAAEELAPCS